MTIDLETLNENQLAAVNWTNGPLLVLAGPGSGKTRVLTSRVAKLIEATPDKHFKILALTFTNAAATEMRERVAALVSDADQRTQMTTFHSFSGDLLRQHGHHIGLRPDFTILVQDADRHGLLEEAIERTTIDTDTTSERLLPLITRMIENDVDVSTAFALLRENSFDNAEAIAEIYRKYRELQILRNSLDFPSLIAEALSLLRNQIGVRKQVQRIYPYVCVDEFQDTNLIQYEILRQIVNPATRNVFIVADDDQIIYQWNGASPDRLSDLVEDYGAELVQLPENYRCPEEVVNLANKLIANNFGRFEGKSSLTAHKSRPSKSVVTVKKFETFDDEAAWVAADIYSRPDSERSRSVILARTKKLLEVAVEALEQVGLAGYLALKKNEFEGPSLAWLHSILRLANARTSRDYLRSVCKAFFSLEGIDLKVGDVIAKSAETEGDYLRAWISSVLDRDALSTEARDLIRGAVTRLSDRLDFWSFEASALGWLDCLPDARPDQGGVFDEYEDEKATWKALIAEIRSQYGYDDVTLHLLLQELDLRSKSPPPPKDGIPCFTIHASKGLEFDHVYLIGLVEDQLPSWLALKKGDDSHELREERRNCFVAITRAQESLTLTYADRVNGWRKTPSRFLREMGLL